MVTVLRGGALAALLVVTQFLSACASLDRKPASVAHQAQMGRVAIVAAAQAPAFRFEGFAHGKGEGAVAGAGGTFVACMSAPGGGCSGEFCAAMLLLWLGVCGVAGLAGGVAGAATAPPAAATRHAEVEIARAVEIRTVQRALRDRVEAAARDGRMAAVLPAPSVGLADADAWRTLAAAGADSVLETSLVEAGTEGPGTSAPAAAYLKARVRLLRVADRSPSFEAEYTHHGRRLTFAGWSANGGAALLQELQAGYETLGRHIAESVFALYPLPDRGTQSAGGALSTAAGLAPLDPPTRGQLSGDPVIGSSFEWVAVDSLRPTLRWQAFPRPSDVARSPSDMARVRNVRYDLVIALEENLVPARVVYRRDGLSQPEHALQAVLQPGTRYFWTVRARFELDARERLTEWASTSYWVREQYTAPSRFSYRFRTP